MKVLKFAAEWCGPCKSLSQLIEKYYTGDIPIEEVDIDQDRHRAVDMGVRAVPTCILLDDNGVEVNRKTGMMMIDEFEKFLKGE
jgi:thioredoxin-like negative regulator of GroEL